MGHRVHLLDLIYVGQQWADDPATGDRREIPYTQYVTACGMFFRVGVNNTYVMRGAKWPELQNESDHCDNCKKLWEDFNFAMDDLRSKR